MWWGSIWKNSPQKWRRHHFFTWCLTYTNYSSMPDLRTEKQMSAYTHTPDQKNSASVSDDCGNLCSLHLQPHVELIFMSWSCLSIPLDLSAVPYCSWLVPCGESSLTKTSDLQIHCNSLHNTALRFPPCAGVLLSFPLFEKNIYMSGSGNIKIKDSPVL